MVTVLGVLGKAVSSRVGSVAIAVLSAGSAVGAVLANAPGLRLAAASVAIAAGAVWWLWCRRFGGPRGHFLRRLGWWLVVVMLSSAATAGILIGVATWVGRWLADREGPLNVPKLDLRGVTFSVYDGGVLFLALVVGALFTRWIGCACEAFGCTPSFKRLYRRILLAGAMVLVLFGSLTARHVPNEELDPTESRRARELGGGRYDRLLVIDPADPAGRRLIQLGRQLVAERREPALVDPPARTVGYDVAYGLAVADPPDGDRPLWRLVEPPTDDPYELAASLAGIEPRDGPPASGSYGRLLADAVIPQNVRWRTGAQRGLLFVLDELPSLEELDGPAPGTAAIARWADPALACGEFAPSPPPPLPESRSEPVPWGRALAEQCREPVSSRAALDVLAGENSRGRVADWRTWARALGGRLTSWGDADPGGQWMIDEARDQLTGQPVGELSQAIDAFRPHLRFDRDEQFFPVDIDWLLTPELRQGRMPVPCVDQEVVFGQLECAPRVPDDEVNRVCDRKTGKDNCRDIANAASLVGDLDEFIDFAGGGRLGRDRIGKNRGPSRMYVHVREHERQLYLGYWWFIPFNASPWRPEVNCLPGLAIKDRTCFDHEGDWEGITVVLDKLNERALPDPYRLSNLKPAAVLYESHGKTTRWPWELVELATEDDRLYASHPVVYVAKGSHASYPAPCDDDEDCDQDLAGNGSLGEGGFDGGTAWTYNNDCAEFEFGTTGENLGPCLIALPATTDGSRGVLWNAFPGRWGKATCSIIAKFCSAVDGPQTPSLQKRFREPWIVGGEGVPRTLRGARARSGGVAGNRTQPIWPPAGRPIPDTLELPR